jgi:hypothetical protein
LNFLISTSAINCSIPNYDAAEEQIGEFMKGCLENLAIRPENISGNRGVIVPIRFYAGCHISNRVDEQWISSNKKVPEIPILNFCHQFNTVSP